MKRIILTLLLSSTLTTTSHAENGVASIWSNANQKPIVIANICDSDESCAHLGGVITERNEKTNITVAVICETEEICTFLSGIITSNTSPEADYTILPLKIIKD